MKYLHLILFSLGIFSLNAQEIPTHEYFVEWRESNRNLNAFITQCNSQLIDVQYINSYKPFGIISFPSHFDPQEEIRILRNEPLIKYFNNSRRLHERACSPNDPQYNKQWNLGKMEFDEVWCYANDGISPLGDTLVVGLMDFGFDYKLADILPNVFVNHGEIPGNNLDDDGNGYIDDYHGYSPISLKKDDQHPIINHGTEVISIMGAKGNNLKGITGSAQNIKVLMCSGTTEAHMVSCYTYFYRMKELYLQSGGKKGAFVVATSLSLGFDFSFPEEFPNVCPLYDWLGSIGILNVCATVNKPDHDVGLKGDVPSLCPSDFLITVTNTDINDRFVSASGYSNIHIDLGASGEQVPVIQMGGGIDFSAGCSLSAPQVAAGILLLNQFCLRYAQLLKNKPSEAAKLLKSMVLDCGDPLPTLQDITVSGKRFNVYKSMLCLERYCNSLQDQSFIKIVNNPILEGLLKINLAFDQFGPYTLRIINAQGQIIDQIIDEHLPGSMDQFLERNISHYPSGVYYIQFIFGDFKEAKGFIKY